MNDRASVVYLWLSALSHSGGGEKTSCTTAAGTHRHQRPLSIHYNSQLKSVVDREATKGLDGGSSWPLQAYLTDGNAVECDFVVSATGVSPNTEILGAEFQVGR